MTVWGSLLKLFQNENIQGHLKQVVELLSHLMVKIEKEKY
jgi:hypothetical protein